MKHISIISILALLLSLLFGITLSGCGHKGNGKMAVEKRHVGAFTSIQIEQEAGTEFTFGDEHVSRFHVNLIADSVEFTSVEYDENLIHHIKTESVNNQLIIHTNKSLRSNKDILVNVHYKDLQNIEVLTFAEVVFDTPFQGRKLTVDVSGACDLKGEILSEELSMSVSGVLDMNVRGNVLKMNIDISGVGDVLGENLISDTCYIDISGVVTAKMNVQKYLNIDASGVVDVIYKGNPVVAKEISGTGDVIQSKKDTIL